MIQQKINSYVGVEVLTKVFHVLIVVYYAYVVELTCLYDIIDNIM